MRFLNLPLLLIYFGFLLGTCRSESQANFGSDEAVPIEIHRIVAVGDVHGDVNYFRQILSMAGVISWPPNDEKHVLWAPKWEEKEIELHKRHNTKLRMTFIQMGDLIDRGEDDLGVLEMAFSLFNQVKLNYPGDKVVLLLGNHELLNLQGHFHYVHPESMGGFISKELRKRAFGTGGYFRRFLLENFTALYLDADSVFVHAGLNERFASLGVEGLNGETMQAIREGNYQHPVLGSSGPLWTRQMIMDAMNDKCANIRKILSSLGVERIVVGHTPQRSGHVETYCDDSVIAVDVGLSRWMYGNLAALELTVTTFKTDIGLRRDIVMREIVTSDIRRTQTIDEGLKDSLFLEELNHAVEEFYHNKKSDASDVTSGDL